MVELNKIEFTCYMKEKEGANQLNTTLLNSFSASSVSSVVKDSCPFVSIRGSILWQKPAKNGVVWAHFGNVLDNNGNV